MFWDRFLEGEGKRAVREKPGKRQLAIRFASGMSEKEIGIYASSTAFFIFLSMIPILVVLTALLPYTGLSEADLQTALLDVIPAAAGPLVKLVIKEAYRASSGMVPISLLLTLWSASRGMLPIISGLNQIYEVEEKRNYLVLRFVAAVNTLLLLLLVIVMLLLMVFSTVIHDFLGDALPGLWIFSDGWVHSRTLFTIGISMWFFMLFYANIPAKRQPFFRQLPGAVFTAVAWSVFSYAFSVFVGNADYYSSYYGSLGTLILLLFWLYWCVYILLIGAYVNRFFMRLGEGKEGV